MANNNNSNVNINQALNNIMQIIAPLGKPDPVYDDCSEVALKLKSFIANSEILTIMSPRDNVSINTFITETYGKPSINYLGEPFDFHSVLLVNVYGVYYVIDMFSNNPIQLIDEYIFNLKNINNGIPFVTFVGEYDTSYNIRLLEKLNSRGIAYRTY